jgi:uncharacterized OB-fold protein
MECDMIHTFRNLDYTTGTNLVKCHNCGALMMLPTHMDKCPECGDKSHLETIEHDINGDTWVKTTLIAQFK